MSVLIDTSLGAITVDLAVDGCPNTSRNFIKLCKCKYYNGCLFYNVQQDFMVQTGDPTATGRGGSSVYGLLYGNQAQYFEDEFSQDLRHDRIGTLSMANAGPHTNRSQFLITTRDDNSSMNDHNAVFGHVVDGMSVVHALNRLYVDDHGRPLQDVRITHTHVLVDPFPDPPGLQALVPPSSPTWSRPPAESVPARLAIEEEIEAPANSRIGLGAGEDGVAKAAAEAAAKERLAEEEARARAVVLEMTGDLPSADVAPPENVLFVCKLNPITRGEDLGTIFSRFGKVIKAEVVRDSAGDSMCYAFVEFGDRPTCEAAYAKMNNVLIDDRRIKVDFSQSVSHLWNKHTGVTRRAPQGERKDYQHGQGRAGYGRGGPLYGNQGAQGTGARTGGVAESSQVQVFDEGRGGLQRPGQAVREPRFEDRGEVQRPDGATHHNSRNRPGSGRSIGPALPDRDSGIAYVSRTDGDARRAAYSSLHAEHSPRIRDSDREHRQRSRSRERYRRGERSRDRDGEHLQASRDRVAHDHRKEHRHHHHEHGPRGGDREAGHRRRSRSRSRQRR